MARIRNLFISHVHEDDGEVHKLREMLERNGHEVRDSSVTTDKPNDANHPDYIKREILSPRIQWAGVMVVIVGPNTHTSDWVNWEIEHAAGHGKRIVGIYVRGGKESNLPDALKTHGDALVGWNSDNLIGAVDGEHDSWCEPAEDGTYTPRSPQWAIERYRC